MSDIRRCGLITRFADDRVSESALVLAAHLRARGLAVLAPEDERERLGLENVQFVDDETLAREADLMIAIGGDGTLLYAARLVAARGTPLLGINRGRLGFLTDIMPADMLSGGDAALSGQCLRDERQLLRAELHRRADGAVLQGLALNDVVLQTSKSGQLIDYDTWIDGHFLAVPKYTKNADWAMQFISMACSRQWQLRSMVRGNAPPRIMQPIG